MFDDMAPPRKRRRLAPSPESLDEMSLFEPIPTLRHTVSDLEYDSDTYGARRVPKRIEEVHLHIQQRSAAQKQRRDEGVALQKRQSAYEITTVDAEGNTILSTVTAGLRAGAASSFIVESDSTTTSTSTRTRDSSTRSTRSTETSNSRVSAVAASTSSTDSENGSNSKTTHITLNNNNVRTVTRSANPYVTTFPDGESFTICGRNNVCRINTESTAQSSTALAGAQSSAAAANGNGASQSDNNDGDGGPSLGTIAGGVVGGCAGIALILILILVWLRWYKRKKLQGHHALVRDSSLSPEPDHSSASHSAMTERAGTTPLVGAAPGLSRYQDKSPEETGSTERGFAKLSGRKMPSAFGASGGGIAHRDMNSPPPDMPLTSTEKDLAGTTFYRDSSGFYGGRGVSNDENAPYDPSVSPEPSQASGDIPADVTLSPGPQRRPTIHEPGPYVVTHSSSSPNTPVVHHARSASGPGLSPFLEREGARSGTPTTMGGRSETPTYARSETPSSIPDNRSSRFTEDF